MPSAERVDRVEYFLLNEADNVLILPQGGAAGNAAGDVILAEAVPPGHKVARSPIGLGKPVVKYGHPIGAALWDIRPGEWVHGHNTASRLGTDAERLPVWKTPAGPRIVRRRWSERTFQGFRRGFGRPGVRNDLWIIPTVGCINGELRALARDYHKPYWIDAVRVLEHPYGCSQLGGDLKMTEDILAGLALNPNAAGILLVGLGCENLSFSDLLDRIDESVPSGGIKGVNLQESGVDGLAQDLDRLASNAPRTREPYPLSDLCVGVKCGGSDGYSGLTANPLVGRFADFLVAEGGTIAATEIPELFGAEDVLAGRMCNRRVFDSFMKLDHWFRDYFRRHGRPIYENPSPGNREGGITTLEEKSLGAVEKTGSAPVTNILRYGENIRADDGGVQITFGPGNDLVSCTALAGCGAQLILFTTGRGTPFGSVVPTLKIATNTPLAENHPGWIDFDAGSLLTGESWESAMERLVERVLSVVSGEKVAHEKKGFGEIAIFKDGVTL